MYYILKNEKGATVFMIKPTKTNLNKLEKEIGKSIDQVNEELKEKGYFEYDNQKIYLETMFID